MSFFLNTGNKEIEAMRDFLMCKNIIVTSGKLGMDNCSIECATLMKRYLGIEISTKDENAFRCLTLDDVRYVEDMVGCEVPDPFYRGFPESVRNMSIMAEYLDRILHYHSTYGQNNFDGPASHSLFEEIVERTGVEEHVEVKKMLLIAPTDFFDTVKDILTEQLKSSRPLDTVSFNALRAYIIYNGSMDDFKEINSRQTLIELFFNFYMNDKNMDIAYKVADRFNLEDVYKLIKLVAAKKKQELNQLSLSNQERNMITLCIRRALEHTTYSNDGNDKMIEDAYAHRKVWCGVLHHIHFKPHTDRQKYFVTSMRSGANHSVMAIFEQYMNDKDTLGAAEYLYRKRGLPFLLRHLDYILSRTPVNNGNKVSDDILKIIERDKVSTNVVVLLQLYQKYSMPDRAKCRTFTYTYNNKVVSYTEEDPKPYGLTIAQRKAVCNCIARTLSKKLANRLEGVAYINPEMSNIAVEINGSATNKGLGTLPIGSRMKLPEGRIFRLFTYWSGADDVDLSIIGLDEEFNMCSEFSWRTLGQRGPILFSGDITNGFHGASEYFDVNLTQVKIVFPDMKYLVCCDNLFRGGHGVEYLDQCTCTAGYMVRSDMGSKDGSIFDPKTVATSFKVTSHSKFATLFMIDLETRELIWVNRNIDSRSRIAGDQNFDNMYTIANSAKVMNLAMLVQSAAEGITTNPEDADIIVDWELPENAKEGARLVRPCDTEIVASILK